MDYSIVWTKTALADLAGLVRYIAADDPRAAKRLGELIISKVESISDFPRIGRIVPEYREDVVRELIVRPYRIVYELDDGARTISVLRIWHGARGDLSLVDE